MATAGAAALSWTVRQHNECIEHIPSGTSAFYGIELIELIAIRPTGLTIMLQEGHQWSAGHQTLWALGHSCGHIWTLSRLQAL